MPQTKDSKLNLDRNHATDGRVQRSVRSRQIIIDAMLSLVNQGNLIPTAQQVADEAGVAIRTVFRHFSEMEKLYEEMDAYLQPTYRDLFSGGDRSGSLEQRLLHAVECHAQAYTALSPVIQSTLSQVWRWPGLNQNYQVSQRRLRKDFDHWLPELKDLSSESRHAIDAVTSFEFWDRLRSRQGLGKRASITLIVNLVSDLLKPGTAGRNKTE